jgi:outer membrane protein assembly factor BamB
MGSPNVPVPSSLPLSESPAPTVALESVPPRPRLWPAVLLIVVQWLIILIPAWLAPVTMVHFMGSFLGPIIGVVALAIWWLFASRVRWVDRLLVLFVCLAAAALTFAVCDKTIGLMGLVMYALPTATTAWVLWLVVTPFLGWPVRRLGLLIVLVAAWGWPALLRFEGTSGALSAYFQFRWKPTAEEQFLADLKAGKLGASPSGPSALSQGEQDKIALQAGDWPGFRGPDRDSRLAGVRIATDWQAHPPRQLWRHRVGPGWSSFAVVGNRLFTQEQRGEEETVICYDAGTGTERWTHGDKVRFNELIGGPGPRATPTFHEGKLYTQGATGRLNCLEAATGQASWSRDIAADSGAQVPTWGFAASPLVAQGIVTVFAGGPTGKSVLGYHSANGEPAWSAGEGQFSYCSPHRVQLGGVEQLVISTDQGLSAFNPTDGKVLWRHDWPLQGGMARVVQPTPVGESDFLFGASFGIGSRRVHVRREGDGWQTQEVWTTRAIKPYFSDGVVHRGYFYGFDNDILMCLNLENGQAKWKARSYGSGQLLLLPDQDLLLVMCEQGAVALVDAAADQHHERSRFQALEGKTWNHPVLAHGRLYLRNGEEAACYELLEESNRVTAGR